ncbi:FAD-binding protein [uncultured Devosia sp.]|uniref:FAD-binding protein n=1 Tax=uncultured Devosia sp. TaxID=211434 RepID=UPI002626C3EE|nr:FAD-binding protein [uncultured Devosia sp.]
MKSVQIGNFDSLSTAPTNWAGNIAFGASSVLHPATVEQAQAAVRSSHKVRVLGSGHSFNRIADTNGTLISLSKLKRNISIDAEAQSVTIDGGATYADIAPQLHRAGFALANVASLPSITVAGAVVTATHGSGDGNKNLSAAVSALKLITTDGELISLKRGDAAFEGAVVSLGSLGVIVELTLDIVPSFDIRQNVYLNLPMATVTNRLDELMSRAYSVSLFTRWQGETTDQIWVKARAQAGEPAEEIFGATPATIPCHPIPGMDGTSCTRQMGVVGPWHERLFHFAIGSTASAGAELQSEFFVARKDAPTAIEALHAVQDTFAPALFISEIRSVAADNLWLSSAYQQDTIGFHFTWKPDWEPALSAIGAIEATLRPLRARPHWAKVFTMPSDEVQALFPRLTDFCDLADRLDSASKFRNRFVTDLLFA